MKKTIISTAVAAIAFFGFSASAQFVPAAAVYSACATSPSAYAYYSDDVNTDEVKKPDTQLSDVAQEVKAKEGVVESKVVSGNRDGKKIDKAEIRTRAEKEGREAIDRAGKEGLIAMGRAERAVKSELKK